MLLSQVFRESSQSTVNKSPTKSVLKGRAGLQENVYQTGALPSNPKPKGLQFASSTPLHGSFLRGQPLKDELGSPKKPLTTTTVSRPLLDKTPFPNRIANLATPGPQKNLALADASPDSPLFPSATRKRGRVPTWNTQVFVTPVNKGNPHEIDEASFDDSVVEGDVAGVQEDRAEVEEEYGDIEYMPPTAIFPDYEPPFEMPCYKTLGKSLLAAARSYPVFDDTDYPPPSYDYEPGGEFSRLNEAWLELSLQLRRDDTNAKAPVTQSGGKPTTVKATTKRQPVAATASTSASGPGLTTARTRLQARVMASRSTTPASGLSTSTAGRKTPVPMAGARKLAAPAPGVRRAATTSRLERNNVAAAATSHRSAKELQEEDVHVVLRFDSVPLVQDDFLFDV